MFGKQLHDSNRYKAFTLAEVLITLGIIGVVAAIIIPPLINNYQKKVYVAQLKKFYTEFNQALVVMSVNKGCSDDLACTEIFAYDEDTQQSANNIGTEIVKYIKTSKNCGTAANQNCWSEISTQNENTDAYKFVTIDGASIAIISLAWAGPTVADCKASNNMGGEMENICAEVYVDVNGVSKPNKEGLDVFLFWITNGKGPAIYPYGGNREIESNRWKNSLGVIQNCQNGFPDAYCAGRIIEENWQMNY